ncbi:hypothetical protein IWQ60_009776 [Tieghemiomyces parasiticus]|uniref:Nucleoporin Nup159/Nup146 N-terminal domain-containing protein n=1 Tax=Tieghemiomyces parasiticus TaxID=78921 RepID=A0A9W8DNZ6_9FUNG|nr:hypothetical protein IWQ60_009776 [Tieghemiomyces parasiticus]
MANIRTLEEVDNDRFSFREIKNGFLYRMGPAFHADQIPGFCSLLAVSNKHRVLLAATTDGVVVVETGELENAWRSAPSMETKAIDTLDGYFKFSIPDATVHQVAVDASEDNVLVGLADGRIMLFQLTSLVRTKDPTRTFAVPTVLGVESCNIRDLRPNPKAFPHLAAVLYTTGQMHLVNIETGAVVHATQFPPKDRITAISWSRLGKQLMLGTISGEILQFNAEGKTVKRLPSPPPDEDAQADRYVVYVRWLENMELVAVYNDRPDNVDDYFAPQPKPVPEREHNDRLYVVSWTKNLETITYLRNYSPCMPGGCTEREGRYFGADLHHWGSTARHILALAGTMSPDVATVAQNTSGFADDKIPGGWETWILDETKRAMLALTRPGDEDTTPVGLALYLASDTILPPIDPDAADSTSPAAQDTPPVPILFVYSTDATLNAYYLIYETAIVNGLPYPGMVTDGSPLKLPLVKSEPPPPTVKPVARLSGQTLAPSMGFNTAFGHASAKAAGSATKPALSFPPSTVASPASRPPAAVSAAANVSVPAAAPPGGVAEPAGLHGQSPRSRPVPASKTSTDGLSRPREKVQDGRPTPEEEDAADKARMEHMLLQLMVRIYADFDCEMNALRERLSQSAADASRFRGYAEDARLERTGGLSAKARADHPAIYTLGMLQSLQFMDFDGLAEATKRLHTVTADTCTASSTLRRAVLDLQSAILNLESKRSHAAAEVRRFEARLPQPGGGTQALDPEAHQCNDPDGHIASYFHEARQTLRTRYDEAEKRLRVIRRNVDFLQRLADGPPGKADKASGSFRSVPPPPADATLSLRDELARSMVTLAIGAREHLATLNSLELALERLGLDCGESPAVTTTTHSRPSPARSTVATVPGHRGFGVSTSGRRTASLGSVLASPGPSVGTPTGTTHRPTDSPSRPWRTPAPSGSRHPTAGYSPGDASVRSPRTPASPPSSIGSSAADSPSSLTRDTPSAVALLSPFRTLGLSADQDELTSAQAHRRAAGLQSTLARPVTLKVNRCTAPATSTFDLTGQLNKVACNPIEIPGAPSTPAGQRTPAQSLAPTPEFASKFGSPASLHRPSSGLVAPTASASPAKPTVPEPVPSTATASAFVAPLLGTCHSTPPQFGQATPLTSKAGPTTPSGFAKTSTGFGVSAFGSPAVKPGPSAFGSLASMSTSASAFTSAGTTSTLAAASSLGSFGAAPTSRSSSASTTAAPVLAASEAFPAFKSTAISAFGSSATAPVSPSPATSATTPAAPAFASSFLASPAPKKAAGWGSFDSKPVSQATAPPTFGFSKPSSTINQADQKTDEAAKDKTSESDEPDTTKPADEANTEGTSTTEAKGNADSEPKKANQDDGKAVVEPVTPATKVVGFAQDEGSDQDDANSSFELLEENPKTPAVSGSPTAVGQAISQALDTCITASVTEGKLFSEVVKQGTEAEEKEPTQNDARKADVNKRDDEGSETEEDEPTPGKARDGDAATADQSPATAILSENQPGTDSKAADKQPAATSDATVPQEPTPKEIERSVDPVTDDTEPARTLATPPLPEGDSSFFTSDEDIDENDIDDVRPGPARAQSTLQDEDEGYSSPLRGSSEGVSGGAFSEDETDRAHSRTPDVMVSGPSSPQNVNFKSAEFLQPDSDSDKLDEDSPPRPSRPFGISDDNRTSAPPAFGFAASSSSGVNTSAIPAFAAPSGGFGGGFGSSSAFNTAGPGTSSGFSSGFGNSALDRASAPATDAFSAGSPSMGSTQRRPVPGLEDEDEDDGNGMTGTDYNDDIDLSIGNMGGFGSGGARQTTNSMFSASQTPTASTAGPFSNAAPAFGGGFSTSTGTQSQSQGGNDASRFFTSGTLGWGNLPAANSNPETSSRWGGGNNSGAVTAFGAINTNNGNSSNLPPAFQSAPTTAAAPVFGAASAFGAPSVSAASSPFARAHMNQPQFGRSSFGQPTNNPLAPQPQAPNPATAPIRGGGFSSYANGPSAFASLAQQGSKQNTPAFGGSGTNAGGNGSGFGGSGW